MDCMSPDAASIAREDIAAWARRDAPLFPRNLLLPNHNDLLTCQTLERHVRAQRLVCAGVWGQREVFVKLFVHRRRRWLHWRREDRGVRTLLARGIDTPGLLFSGAIEGGELYVIVTERIRPAQTVLDVWSFLAPDQRAILLRRLVETLACHHQQGLAQQDLHLKNFLLSGERLLSLDGAGFRILRKPVSKRMGLDNLGLLFAQFPLSDDQLIAPAFADYCRLRQETNELDRSQLDQAIAKNRRYRSKKYLKKIFRTCSAFVSRRDAQCYYVLDRRYDSPELRQLIADLQKCHAGSAEAVWWVAMDGYKLKIESHISDNFLQALSISPLGSPATAFWRAAHRRKLEGKPTPEPVALIERRLGAMRRLGYFISHDDKDDFRSQ